MAVFAEEERRAKKEVYVGTDSLGKRALQRVLMRKQLEQMSVELRELMVYQSPPELGALYTEVEAMMKEMGKEQRVLVAKQMQAQRTQEFRRKQRMNKLYIEISVGMSALVICAALGICFSLVVEDRIRKYPQYGTGWIPRTELQRKKDSESSVYVGR
jgi:rubrerythrin